MLADPKHVDATFENRWENLSWGAKGLVCLCVCHSFEFDGSPW